MALRGGARVARLLVWCDGETSVRRAYETFTDVLGLASKQAPARRSSATWFKLASDQYHAAVTDGRISIEFASVDWISAARRAGGCPAAQQLLAICLQGVDPGLLETAQPSVTQSALLLQQLAWIGQPSCHPMIFRDPASHEDEDAAVGARTGTSSAHVKEIVFGEEENRFYATSNLLRGLATQSVQPGVISFGASAAYEDVIPALRILPSSASALVLRVDNLEDFKGKAIALEEEEEDRQGAPTGTEVGQRVSFVEIPGRGRGSDQLQVEAPFISGLDVRLSASDAIETSFVEVAQSSIGDVGNVQFGRQDMGTMSCRSVNAMEVRARFNRIPKDVLRRLGSRMRPEVR
ncbi:Hypothetical Protein FCC1311_107682 [Hondaea fermentalgiana]|uniref:Uncharacterized protein n=1 Tax=Hondaea fermentalgiana TaxID=2315210 RepID=A0A2R5H2C9_9STRA|nr:Hypothetical Protein FCC1311_107682 [Hondaea fermentalgiana]|eukprot:GBG34544.1 Hypothetical Protein FCC1311_107682 [Hondaea fermentalgiana]